MMTNISAPFAARATNWLTHIRPRSLRVRLALWGLLLLGLTQIVVSTVLYLAISTWLEEEVNKNILLTANQVASVLYDAEDIQNPLDVTDVKMQLANNNIVTQSFLRDQMFVVRLVDLPTGAILASSADYTIPTLPLQSAEASFQTVTFANDNPMKAIRLYTLPLSYAPQYALQVGISLEETREIQEETLRILLLLFLVTAILALLSGWFLANRALVPIRATARTAAEINERDLTRRLDLAASEIELEQLVQTFNAMLDRIEQAFQRQHQFTADAAHELRTPLSIMQTGLEVTLGKERSSSEYQMALVSVQEEVHRLSQLANALLTLARSDAYTLPPDMQEINLSMLVETVVEQFSVAAKEKGINIACKIAPNLTLEGSEDQLIRVVVNLIDNAVKYTPENGHVHITAQSATACLEMVVENNGPGIPVEQQLRIFDRFYRVDSSRHGAQQGFGLGLAIARHIVDLHRGSIQVMSEPGRVTQFIVALPLSQSTAARAC